MARPRAGSIRLPLYNNFKGPRLRFHPDSPPSRSPSRRKRPLMLQLKYANFWRPRSTARALTYAVGTLVALVFCASFLWELQIEFRLYTRTWVQREVLTGAPLAGCFDAARISPAYNLSHARSPKYNDVQAGLPLQLGMDCYDFAATIQPRAPRAAPQERTNYHTYWRVDLVPFGPRQEWMLKSFFATQDTAASRLILWSNGDLRGDQRVRQWLNKYPEAFDVRTVDIDQLARGTALDGSPLLHTTDRKAWVDGDLVRLLVTWAFGGVWVDMDSLLTRDLAPLLEHEFVTQWDCYDKIYQPFNGALMHFFQHSPYLCEAFDIMAQTPPRSGSTDWGSVLYFKLWRRLVAAAIPPFKVLPFCFTDARSCRLDNRLPDPFVKDQGTWAAGLSMREGGALDEALAKIFSVHLHNQWDKPFPRDGWVERLLLRKYERTLGVEPPGGKDMPEIDG